MIRPGIVLGVARAEARLTRRLARYWVFMVLSLLFATGQLLQFFAIHLISRFSATAASMNPRYLVGAVGWVFITFFLVGLVFLGFDLRARDRRERIVEVLDAQPCSNTELILGKFLGLFLVSWVTVVFVAAVQELISWLLGVPIEPWSMAAFVFLMAIPSFVFFLGLVFFLSMALRHRLVVALAALAFLVFLVSTRWWLPIYALPLTDITGGMTMPFPSDVTPTFTVPANLINRIAFTLIGLGLLWLAAALHPRRDDTPRAVRSAIGTVLLLAGVGTCVGQVFYGKGLLQQTAAWEKVHAARRADAVPDMLGIEGQIDVRPGSDLSMRLSLRFAAPEDSELASALFTLNPGLEVKQVRGAGAAELDHEFKNALLDVSLEQPLPPGEETTIDLVIEGTLDANFGYLDSALNLLDMNGADASVALLGYNPFIYESRFVALLPGTRWLPAAGSDVGRADPRDRPADFFDVDLTVELPEGWLAAGPGRRQQAEGAADGRVRFRFAPASPMPEVALVASRFESLSAEVNGVEFEALYVAKHAPNYEIFEEAAGEIRDWLSEKLTEAEESGLTYPYDALTLVEVPNSLRGYAGGWRMDTTFAQPAMMLLRESSFPTARFDWRYKDTDRFADREGGLPRVKLEDLERFFESDLNGGNPFVGGSRNFFAYQTVAEGEEGLPLDFVFENLSTRVLTDKVGYFSVHLFDGSIGESFQKAQVSFFSPDQFSANYTENMIHVLTSTTDVWEAILEVSLAEIDPWADPEQTINVLSLKGGAMAESLMDTLGREKTIEVLSALRTRAEGGSFSRDDVIEVGREVGEDLEPWIDTWLRQVALPGFILGDVTSERITDSEDGTPRYQVKLTLVNEEDTAGLLRVDYRTERTGPFTSPSSTEPVRIPAQSAVEIGLVSSKPPTSVRVVPYLALNREPFAVPLPSVDEEEIVEAEPFTGSREVMREQARTDAVIVDDLDPGFSVKEQESRGMLRFGGAGGDVQLDRGLPIPVGFKAPDRWSRKSATYAYGKYRHTLVLVKKGKGQREAIFTAELDRAGEWGLEFYLPKSTSRNRRAPTGVYRLTVVDAAGEEHEATLDVEQSETGWNPVQEFDLPDGETRVKLSDETDGQFVVADAIRWTPLGRETARADVQR